MKKNTSRLLNYTFALCILFVWSCSTEEAALTQTLDVQKWFNENVTKDDFPILNYVDKIDWKNAIVTNGSQGEATEIPLLLEDNIGSAEKNKSYEFYRIMIVKSSSGLFKSYFIQINTQDNTFTNIDPDFNFYTIDENFNGSILIKELKSKKISSIKFKNGQKNRPSITARIDVYCLEYGLIYDGGFDSYYTLGCWTGGGGSSQPIEYPVDQPNPSGGGGGGNNNNGNCGPGYRWRLGKCELIYKIIQDPSFLKNPCLKAVFDNLGGSAVFQSYLKQFDGSFTVANLKLSANSNIASNINAETSPPVNYMIEISFNSNNLNRPSLDVARTFIHEMIHAEMFRKLLSLSSVNGEINVLTLNQMLTQHNYPGLYDYYMRYGVNGMQHEQMAAHYTETITNFLKDFDNSLSQQQYEAIAWEGLKGTVAWNSKTEQEKQAITDTYNNWKSKAGISCN